MKFSNNAARVIVAVITIPLILAVCYFGGIYFLIFAAAIALTSFYEFTHFTRKKFTYVNYFFGFLFVAFLIINRYRTFVDDLFSAFLIYIVILAVFELFRNKKSAIFNIGATLLGSLYLGFAGASLIGIREYFPHFTETLYRQGGYIIIASFAGIWFCDTFAYYGGTALGKHKLFPRVSPNKSWEGAIFGFIGAMTALIASKFLFLNFLHWDTIFVIGIIIGTIGQIGDLFESLLKRDAGVKDSSNIIPGHGGIFDRFDSLFLSAPVIYLCLKLLEG
ncbi:MAG: phosphatidate cytidylyltransferase [Syntrophothermus sp.]